MVNIKNGFAACVDLVASFRTGEEVVCREYLDNLAAKYPDKFSWKSIVTSEVGRISDSEENVRMVTEKEEFCSIKDTHYHLIGNGQLVNEWKSGLDKAGVANEKVTFEAYFNHQAESNEKAIETIAKVISTAAKIPVS